MTTMTRWMRSMVLWAVVAGASCGPQREPVVDLEQVKVEYCERAVECLDDPEVNVDLCMRSLGEYGVEQGGYYDEQGCLDEEAEFLECLTGMTCDDLYWSRYTSDGGPCNAEWYAVLEAGCDPIAG